MLSTTATATSDVTEALTRSWPAGAIDPNYMITYVAVVITVTQATPTISVTAAGGTYNGSHSPRRQRWPA